MLDGRPLIDAHLHPARLPTVKLTRDQWAPDFGGGSIIGHVYDADGDLAAVQHGQGGPDARRRLDGAAVQGTVNDSQRRVVIRTASIWPRTLAQPPPSPSECSSITRPSASMSLLAGWPARLTSDTVAA